MKTLTIIAAFLALTVTGFAQNGAVQTRDLPIGGIFYNECCDEMVLVTGTAHLVFRNGEFNFNNSHLDMKGATGTAMGESGNTYTQRGATTQNLNIFEDGSYSVTFQVKMVNDDGCSFSIKITQRLTVNANGDVTAEVMNYSITCE